MHIMHGKHATLSTPPLSRSRGRFMECSALRNTNVTEIFRSFLVLGNIPTTAAGAGTAVRRQLSLRLSKRRSASPAPEGKTAVAEVGIMGGANPWGGRRWVKSFQPCYDYLKYVIFGAIYVEI